MKGKKSALLVAAVLTAVVLVIISLIARSGTFQSASTVKNIDVKEETGHCDGESTYSAPAVSDLMPAVNNDKMLHIYLDADMTANSASGIAIKQGIETALAEVDWKLDGRPVELIVKDHQGNTVRSKKHLNDYLHDTRALVVFSGLHSPPLLAHREFINTSEILVLDPWAAAGSITRYPSKDNWIFRLSVDDTKAGYVIADYALKKGYNRPALLLEDTGWGKSNEITMKAALEELGIASPAAVKWFNWNMRETGAGILLREILDAQADVIFLVANAPEGKTFATAMASLPPEKRLPICSHWGITGGDFATVIDSEMRSKIDISFIQTRFSFISCPDSEFGTKVLAGAQSLYPQTIRTAIDIDAPTGFIHAYDLTRILIAAVEQAGMTGDIHQDRRNIRIALENLERPVEGLIKTYKRPFGVFSEDNPDAHEALSVEDFIMARYRDDNGIVLELESPK